MNVGIGTFTILIVCHFSGSSPFSVLFLSPCLFVPPSVQIMSSSFLLPAAMFFGIHTVIILPPVTSLFLHPFHFLRFSILAFVCSLLFRSDGLFICLPFNHILLLSYVYNCAFLYFPFPTSFAVRSLSVPVFIFPLTFVSPSLFPAILFPFLCLFSLVFISSPLFHSILLFYCLFSFFDFPHSFPSSSLPFPFF